MENKKIEVNGFAFIEMGIKNDSSACDVLHSLGFECAYTTKNIIFEKQGIANILLRTDEHSHANIYSKKHGTSISGIGFYVSSARDSFKTAIENGARVAQIRNKKVKKAYDYYAIEAIGGSTIYFIDTECKWFNLLSTPSKNGKNAKLEEIDHITFNVERGSLDKWAQFYIDIFNFDEIKFFNIKGKETGLISRALANKKRNVRIPINESTDKNSQIEKFLGDFKGAGAQHVAFSSSDIYKSIDVIRKNKLSFLKTPDDYYKIIEKKFLLKQERSNKLKKHGILIDMEKNDPNQSLLQIFTEELFGPLFFEIIQRNNNIGFGEGNFQSLFEVIEAHQLNAKGMQNEQKTINE